MLDNAALHETQNEPLLEIESLCKYYPVTQGLFKRVVGQVKAVDDVTLDVRRGETLGIVGESGCGKTTLGKCLVRLYEPTGGRMFYSLDGRRRDLLSLKGQESFKTRRSIQMVFQDPYGALNPMKNILFAFDEALKVHGFGNRGQRRDIVAGMLEKVNLLPDHMYRYPHEFSGGQRQRICIARSLSLQPEIIVCDEPVSALDVSIQAQILTLMRELQKERNLTYIFIAHDLSVVQYMSDRIAVMYLGKVVEIAESGIFSENCLHPYTQALLQAVPVPLLDAKKERTILPGEVPSPFDPPLGCHFHPRCPRCMEVCKTEAPILKEAPGQDKHMVACHLVH